MPWIYTATNKVFFVHVRFFGKNPAPVLSVRPKAPFGFGIVGMQTVPRGES